MGKEHWVGRHSSKIFRWIEAGSLGAERLLTEILRPERIAEARELCGQLSLPRILWQESAR